MSVYRRNLVASNFKKVRNTSSEFDEAVDWTKKQIKNFEEALERKKGAYYRGAGTELELRKTRDDLETIFSQLHMAEFIADYTMAELSRIVEEEDLTEEEKMVFFETPPIAQGNLGVNFDSSVISMMMRDKHNVSLSFSEEHKKELMFTMIKNDILTRITKNGYNNTSFRSCENTVHEHICLLGNFLTGTNPTYENVGVRRGERYPSSFWSYNVDNSTKNNVLQKALVSIREHDPEFFALLIARVVDYSKYLSEYLEKNYAKESNVLQKLLDGIAMSVDGIPYIERSDVSEIKKKLTQIEKSRLSSPEGNSRIILTAEQGVREAQRARRAGVEAVLEVQQQKIALEEELARQRQEVELLRAELAIKNT